MNLWAYIGAAFAEIAGCFAFWAWLRLDRSAWWLIPGIASLCLFAYLLTLVEAEHAGRTYAAYGGVYIASALIWLWLAEGVRPDRWDVLGVAICLIGASVILGVLEPRKSASAGPSPGSRGVTCYYWEWRSFVGRRIRPYSLMPCSIDSDATERIVRLYSSLAIPAWQLRAH